MSTKRALILGIGGQDGSYLADVLLEQGYEVHGFHRRTSNGNLRRIEHIKDRVTMHQGDLLDANSLIAAVGKCQPDEIYNEADQDSVGWSSVTPSYQMAVTAGAVATLLEEVKVWKESGFNIKFFQPCSAMIFGDPALMYATGRQQSPQNEETPFNPQSPYACAKVAAYHLASHYRREHGMHVCTAIFYNHDSPRRTDEYLLHKICKAAVNIAAGRQETLALGNLDARVDIGYAKDYMKAAWRIMQLPQPEDFVIGTGVAPSVWELVQFAFKCADVTEWDKDHKGWASRVTRDDRFWRLSPKSILRANPRKAQKAGVYDPDASMNVGELIRNLVEHFQEEL
jgi:GDPmannose 4,6-dehydratase